MATETKTETEWIVEGDLIADAIVFPGRIVVSGKIVVKYGIEAGIERKLNTVDADGNLIVPRIEDNDAPQA